jgi:hypothetical protein
MTSGKGSASSTAKPIGEERLCSSIEEVNVIQTVSYINYG